MLICPIKCEKKASASFGFIVIHPCDPHGIICAEGVGREVEILVCERVGRKPLAEGRAVGPCPIVDVRASGVFNFLLPAEAIAVLPVSPVLELDCARISKHVAGNRAMCITVVCYRAVHIIGELFWVFVIASISVPERCDKKEPGEIPSSVQTGLVDTFFIF